MPRAAAKSRSGSTLPRFRPAAANLPELLADSTACGNRQGGIPVSGVFCRDVAEVSQDSRAYFARPLSFDWLSHERQDTTNPKGDGPMKKFLVAASAVMALAAIDTANAADMALKAAPAPPAWYDWTGFYVGLNTGYSWGRSSTYDVATTAPAAFAFTTRQNMDGWLGGGQAGYNWQFNKNMLFGLEADIQGTGQRGTVGLPTFVFTPPPGAVALPSTTATGTLAQKLPWFGTVRARLGIEPTDHWLLYVTGGLAYGEVKTTGTATATTAFPGGPVLATFTGSATNSTTRAGWTVGVGSEWVISGPWTAKIEYLYVDLGTVNNTFVVTGGPVGSFTGLTANSRITDNIFRVGVNYRFH
jgi:outer membrane immunogenic protein